MNKLFSILIIILLGTLVVLTLLNNKKEIEETTALAELTVKERPVRVEVVEEKKYIPSLIVSGIIQPQKEITVATEATGKIIWVRKKEGDGIRQGELIAKVDDRLIKAKLDLVSANFEKAKKDFERFQRMSVEDAITPQQLESTRLALAKAESELDLITLQLNNTLIKSPFTGVMSKLFISQNEYLGPGMPVCEVADLSNLKLIVALTEEELKQVHQGQLVEILSEGIEEKPVFGKVENISVRANRVLKFSVEIEVKNNEGLIKAGTLAQAKFTFDEEHGLLIKKAALVNDTSTPKVFVVNNGQVASRELEVKDLQNDQLVIASGLQVGEKVIVEGQTLVREGDKVRVVN